MYSSFSYLTDRLVLLIAVCLEVIETDGFYLFQGIALIGNKNISAKKEVLSFRIQKALSGEAKLFSRFFVFEKQDAAFLFIFQLIDQIRACFGEQRALWPGLGWQQEDFLPGIGGGLRKYLPS